MGFYKSIAANIAQSLGFLALALMLFSPPPPVLATPQGHAAEPQGDGVVQVEAKYVCMINNQRFEKEQIPIKVAAQTYYGCCEMCKEKLRKDAKSRFALDPVSGKKVDKASARIGVDTQGKVYYFESEENLKIQNGKLTNHKQ